MICGWLGYSAKEWKRNERNDEEPGKVCEEEKAGSECWEDENEWERGRVKRMSGTGKEGK
jgi:hypothetical protein